ncbi:putative metal-binding motif-containing protein, partial [Myxococcota bacterium]|nr:putative metal-binding motif-containing protein [Myxococcota bacterium]
DFDGYGDAATPRTACALPAGYVADDTDCDDRDEARFPGAPEVCNELDDDCDDDVDEGVGAETWYLDGDGDGFGDPMSEETACTVPAGAVAVGGDCDDEDDGVFPGATELCNGLDDDCDGVVDDGVAGAPTWYADADGDGHGDPDAPATACEAPEDHVADATDCDDGDAAVHPGAEEACGGLDEDCDGSVSAAEQDGDGDGTTPCDGDCDDASPEVHPGAAESCTDGVDGDCDGTVDEGAEVDADG